MTVLCPFSYRLSPHPCVLPTEDLSSILTLHGDEGDSAMKAPRGRHSMHLPTALYRACARQVRRPRQPMSSQWPFQRQPQPRDAGQLLDDLTTDNAQASTWRKPFSRWIRTSF